MLWFVSSFYRTFLFFSLWIKMFLICEKRLKNNYHMFQTATSFIMKVRLGGKGYQPDSSLPITEHVKGLSDFITFTHKLQTIVEEEDNSRWNKQTHQQTLLYPDPFSIADQGKHISLHAWNFVGFDKTARTHLWCISHIENLWILIDVLQSCMQKDFECSEERD